MNSYKITLTGLLTVILFTVSAFTGTNSDTVTKAGAWEIDKNHSNLTFEVIHFFTPVTGQFNDYSSEIYFDPDNPGDSSIAVDVLVNSIDTDNERRDGHLQSGDFFNAGKYPKITFRSNRITKEGENQFIAHGQLTIKDVTKDIELPFTLLGTKDHPMRENTRIAGIQSTLTIDRTDYGVGVGDWAATAVVGDEVTIRIALELNSVQ